MTEELDKRFDDGEDALDSFDDLFDLSTLKRPVETQTISINLPQWMISALDQESVSLDTRQSTIKSWIAERLKSDVRAELPKVDM